MTCFVYKNVGFGTFLACHPFTRKRHLAIGLFVHHFIDTVAGCKLGIVVARVVVIVITGTTGLHEQKE